MAISRHKLRVKAFELVFQSNIVEADSVIEIAKTDESDYFKNQYVEKAVLGVCEKRDEIDSIISSHLKAGWSLGRLSKVVLAVLRLAIYEMCYIDDVPVGVAINEAVEITKEYGEEKEPAFVNGILAAILKDQSK